MISTLKTHIEHLRRRIPCGHILELGPGRVWPGLRLLHEKPDVELIGLGYTDSELEEARAQVRAKGFRSRAEYWPGSVEDLPLPAQSQDAVISFGGLQSWARPERVFDQIARVLKIGGIVLLGDVHAEAPWLARVAGAWSNRPGREAYRRPARFATLDLRERLAHSRLEAAVFEIQGPDLWIRTI